jgi:hypothetical protein
MKCPTCEGKGGWSEDFGEGTVLHEPCNHCDETGSIPLWEWLQVKFWCWAPEWYFEWWANMFYPYKEPK